MPWGGFVKSQEIEQVWAQGGDFFPNTLRQGMLSRRQRSPPDKFIAERKGTPGHSISRYKSK
ncbi:hypothetical protein KPZU09_42050 [Klebsiella pneumoniae]|uniref:Uncharacterized protein n=1 Tax=Klebsiella pneumoniae TaxID=573 RepID=A0A919HYE8_KLEPN|nr:hypothetical protein KPZU09_42050 [Klebsiella pneumoniae]